MKNVENEESGSRYTQTVWWELSTAESTEYKNYGVDEACVRSRHELALSHQPSVATFISKPVWRGFCFSKHKINEIRKVNKQHHFVCSDTLGCGGNFHLERLHFFLAKTGREGKKKQGKKNQGKKIQGKKIQGKENSKNKSFDTGHIKRKLPPPKRSVLNVNRGPGTKQWRLRTGKCCFFSRGKKNKTMN